MRVAVMRALGLGDLLTAVPALRALRRAYPAAHLQLGTPRGLHPVAGLAGADLDLVDLGPFTTSPPAGALPAVMAGADLAVNLHGRGPQSTELLRRSGPARLVAYGVGAAWREQEHEVARWCRLLAEAGIAADPGDLLLAPPPVPSPAPGAVVLHPGAASPARRWPPARWAHVARSLRQEDGGRRIVVTGSPAEVDLAAAVARQAGLDPGAVLAGRTALPELAALVAGARLVLCGDTGIAHLATAYRTPSVVLFGPVPPALWGPPPDARHRALWAGQRADSDGPGPAPGLLALHPAEVLAAARAALDADAPAPGGKATRAGRLT